MKTKKLLTCLNKYFCDPSYRLNVNMLLGLYRKMDDKEFLENAYFCKFGKQLDLVNPETFNEKLQWLKLNDHNPLYTVMVDKVLARQYVAEKIGEQHLIPLIGVWESPEDIDFSLLPDQFAMKCNHNSGLGMCICSDKSKINIEKVKNALKRGLKQDYYQLWREWPYMNVPPKIIAEQYIESDTGGLTDYKVHCFNGEPKLILVCKDRFSETGLTEDFFSPEWVHLDIRRPLHPNAVNHIEKPEELQEMLSLAKTLSESIPFLRVDFYIVEHHIYFSELTFFPASGFEKFVPEKWDRILGEWLSLPIRQE